MTDIQLKAAHVASVGLDARWHFYKHAGKQYLHVFTFNI